MYIVGTCLVLQWLGLHLPLQGVRVWSLVGKLGSPMTHGQKIKTETKQYCNKFKRDFKNGPHKKILKNNVLFFPLWLLCFCVQFLERRLLDGVWWHLGIYPVHILSLKRVYGSEDNNRVRKNNVLLVHLHSRIIIFQKYYWKQFIFINRRDIIICWQNDSVLRGSFVKKTNS